MEPAAPGSFGAQLKALRERAGFTQEELATIAGLSVHAVSALERGERRRPHVETVRALSSALELPGEARDALIATARAPADKSLAADELSSAVLPVPLTSLLGRDADVQALGVWLADPVARLITLTGPGGAGKTRLALELAGAMPAGGPVRVLFVPLAAIRDPAFVSTAVADAFGLPEVPALDLPKRVRVACTGRPTLLVLDNFEQVLDAAPLVADLLEFSRVAPRAGHQPGSAPRARGAGVHCRTACARGGRGCDVDCRFRGRSGGPAVHRASAGRAA